MAYSRTVALDVCILQVLVDRSTLLMRCADHEVVLANNRRVEAILVWHLVRLYMNHRNLPKYSALPVELSLEVARIDANSCTQRGYPLYRHIKDFAKLVVFD